MKDRIIFKSNFTRMALFCFPMAIIEEAIFAYLAFGTDVIIEANRNLVFIVVTCAIFLAILCMLWLLFKQYLIVNDETVTYCKWFKREKTINWKDATLTETTGQINNVVQPLLIISDGTNEIKFYNVGGKDLQTMKELCKNARERYNIDNLTL